MTLLFGNRPFDFSDFFQLIIKGEIDLSNINYIDVMMKSIDAGFKHIEITGDLPYVLPGVLTEEEITKLVEIKKSKELTYSVHLPLWGIELAAFSKHSRLGSINTIVESIELTKPLEPICWVLHPTGTLTVEFMNMGLPDFALGLVANQFIQFAQDGIEQILDKTDINSRKIAVENIEFPFEKIHSVIEDLDLSICFDTGHLLAGFSGDMKILEFVDRYYERIVELHLHDGEYPRIDHKPLGTHKLPVKDLLLELDNRGFQGPLIYELTLQQAIDSMKYIEKNVPKVLKA